MTKIDTLAVLLLFMGGWLGSLRNSTRNFIAFSGTMLALATAGLYGNYLQGVWSSLLRPFSLSYHWSPPWVLTVSNNSPVWQQTLDTWFRDLPWPVQLKQGLAAVWEGLLVPNNFSSLKAGVEAAFWRGLTGICSLLTVIVITKGIITWLAHFSLRPALGEPGAAGWSGFFIGLAESALLVFLAAALAIPFLIFCDPTLSVNSSFTFSLVNRLLALFPLVP